MQQAMYQWPRLSHKNSLTQAEAKTLTGYLNFWQGFQLEQFQQENKERKDRGASSLSTMRKIKHPSLCSLSLSLCSLSLFVSLFLSFSQCANSAHNRHTHTHLAKCPNHTAGPLTISETVWWCKAIYNQQYPSWLHPASKIIQKYLLLNHQAKAEEVTTMGYTTNVVNTTIIKCTMVQEERRHKRRAKDWNELPCHL